MVSYLSGSARVNVQIKKISTVVDTGVILSLEQVQRYKYYYRYAKRAKGYTASACITRLHVVFYYIINIDCNVIIKITYLTLV